MVILDTCAIIELCKTDMAISEKVLTKIEQGAVVLSVSFAEMACKVKTRKLTLDPSVEEIYNGYLQLSHVEIIDIRVNHWLNAINLHWPENKDPVDLLITAYAMKNKLSIVTSDKQIKKFYKQVIW